MSEEEETSELEEEIVKEIEKASIHEISNDFTQESGGELTEDENKLKEFITESFSSSNISPSLEKIHEVPRQIELEQDFSSNTKTKPQQKMYVTVSQEEKRLYESQSRAMEPPVLKPNRSATQQANFINPLAGRNIPIQDDLQPQIIRPQTHQMKQRLPFEKQDNKYKEVKL